MTHLQGGPGNTCKLPRVPGTRSYIRFPPDSEGESGTVSNLQRLHSSVTHTELSTAIKRSENVAKGLQKTLLQQQLGGDRKCSPGPGPDPALWHHSTESAAPWLTGGQSFPQDTGLKTLVFKAYRGSFIVQDYVLVGRPGPFMPALSKGTSPWVAGREQGQNPQQEGPPRPGCAYQAGFRHYYLSAFLREENKDLLSIYTMGTMLTVSISYFSE